MSRCGAFLQIQSRRRQSPSTVTTTAASAAAAASSSQPSGTAAGGSAAAVGVDATSVSTLAFRGAAFRREPIAGLDAASAARAREPAA